MIGCLDHLQIHFKAGFRLQSCQSPCERFSCAQVASRSFQSEETALTQFLYPPTAPLAGHVKIYRDSYWMDPSFSSVHISPPYLCSTHCLVHILISIQHVLVMKHAPLCYAQLMTESQNVVNTQSWGLRKTMESGLISRSAKGLQLK